MMPHASELPSPSPADRRRRRCAAAPGASRTRAPRSSRAATARPPRRRRSRRRAPAGRAPCRHSAAPSRRRSVGARFAALSAVRARVVTVPASAMHRLQQRDRPRRGGDHRRAARAEPQRRTAACPRCVSGCAPLGELVAPGGVELRPAQAVGILGREHLRDRAVGPDQLPLRGLEVRPFAGGCTASRPDTPSIMTRAHSAIVSPTSAMRRAPRGERPSALRAPTRRPRASCRRRGRRGSARCARASPSRATAGGN